MKLCVVVVLLVCGCGPKATPAEHPVGTGPAITIDQARATALAKVPGTIDHEKLKTTKTGAQVYSFKIVPTGATDPQALTKVEIDAATGEVTKVKDTKRKADKDKDDDD